VDSSGGAGVAADLKTFEAHGLWGACAVTAVTAQNTLGAAGLWPVPGAAVRAQIEAVFGDLGVAAAKVGMLGSAEVAGAVADAVRSLGVGPLVVDPVLASSAGGVALLDSPAALLELVALATVVTPNRSEAQALTGCDDPVDAARALLDIGAQVVMVTGSETARDLVLAAGGAEPVWLEGRVVEAAATHGTGCVLSAALCAELARGMEPLDACVAAKRFVEHALAAGLALGAGAGPVNPGWERAATPPGA